MLIVESDPDLGNKAFSKYLTLITDFFCLLIKIQGGQISRFKDVDANQDFVVVNTHLKVRQFSTSLYAIQNVLFV